MTSGHHEITQYWPPLERTVLSHVWLWVVGTTPVIDLFGVDHLAIFSHYDDEGRVLQAGDFTFFPLQFIGDSRDTLLFLFCQNNIYFSSLPSSLTLFSSLLCCGGPRFWLCL